VLLAPILFLGADVTHPSPDTPSDKKVSIAAMVGSMDPEALSPSLYNVEIRLQRVY
jgi:hypothetical protein